tara:strand:- start:5144 stop:5986 length:843 start_codon:yes stop_codon:yes gene_type:complete
MSSYLIKYYIKKNNNWNFDDDFILTVDKYNMILKNDSKKFNIPIIVNIDFNENYNDENMSFDLEFIYNHHHHGIQFDKQSHSSYKIFLEELNKVRSQKYHASYYGSSRIRICGNHTDDGYTGDIIEYYDNIDNSIKFEGEMEDNEYISGNFYDKSQKLVVICNNICNNKINGFINLIIKKQKKTIEQNNILFENISNYNELNITEDNFVDRLFRIYFNDEYINELQYINLSMDEKLHKNYLTIQELNKKIIQIQNDNIGTLGQINNVISNIYNFITNRRR